METEIDREREREKGEEGGGRRVEREKEKKWWLHAAGKNRVIKVPSHMLTSPESGASSEPNSHKKKEIRRRSWKSKP